MKKKEFVILVDAAGRKKGSAEKLEAHQKGMLHRAFSIFLFNNRNEMLLQQRAKNKYHFAGLWSNACCSHPRPGEKTRSAASRRLLEELNIDAPIKKKGTILYKFYDENSELFEHEYDYVFTGRFNGEINFNRDEVAAIKWISLSELKRLLKISPENFTPWLKEILNRSENIFNNIPQ